MQKKKLSLALLLIGLSVTLAVSAIPVSGWEPVKVIWAIQNGLGGTPPIPDITAFEIPTGTILRQFDAPVSGNGRGIAFDGSSLYYTLYPDPGKIYKMDTMGADLGSILLSDPDLQLGAITWDGIQLWGGAYDGTSNVYTIDPITGVATYQFTFTFPSGDSQYGTYADQYIDGLEYNDNTLWISSDAGKTVYHIDLTGSVISSFSIDPKGNTGIVFEGTGNLWLVIYDPPNPDVTYTTGIIQETTTTGTPVSSFAHDQRLYEDLAGVDTITFTLPDNVIPEYPLGTIVGLVTSLAAFAVFAKSRRLRL